MTVEQLPSAAPCSPASLRASPSESVPPHSVRIPGPRRAGPPGGRVGLRLGLGLPGRLRVHLQAQASVPETVAGLTLFSVQRKIIIHNRAPTMQAQSDMAWRRRVLREEAVMERGLSQSALLASAPATGSWGRKQGYSKKAFRPNREGQIHPVADAQRHLLGSKGTRRTSSALAIPAMDSSGSGGAQMKNIQNLSVNPFNSRPNTRVATRDGVNATSMRPPSGRLVPPLAPLRAATPAASQKVSEWMSRSGAVGSKARHFKDDDDVQSVRSGASGYSYSSGTSLQSYSGTLFAYMSDLSQSLLEVLCVLLAVCLDRTSACMRP